MHAKLATMRSWPTYVRPLVLRPVPIEFHTIAIRIVKVDRLAHTMIGSAIGLDTVIEQTLERDGECGAGRVKNGEMIQAGAARRRLRRTFPRPGVQSDMMMVTAGR